MRPATLFAAFLASVLACGATARAQYGDISDVKLNKPEDKEDVEIEAAPEGATVLLDAKTAALDNWEKRGGGAAAEWDVVELKDGNKAIQVKPGGGDIVTKEKFDKPFKLHVEFRVPYQPGDSGQGRGNSGVYMQGRY